jgi:hypothetical protein
MAVPCRPMTVGAQQRLTGHMRHAVLAAAPRPCCRDAWHCIPIRSILFILSKKPLNPWLRTARFESLLAGTARQGRGRTEATESWRCTAQKPLSCVRERGTARVPACGDSPPGRGRTGTTGIMALQCSNYQLQLCPPRPKLALAAARDAVITTGWRMFRPYTSHPDPFKYRVFAHHPV